MGCMMPRPCCAPPMGMPMPVPMPMVWCVWPMPMPAMQTQVRSIELDAKTTSATAIAGGTADSRLTVEYYVEPGISDASVTLTLVTDGQTASWTDQNVAAGYHVHAQLPAVPPGTKLTLAASSALARLRWCESFCC